jgi:hypothetical protein
MRIRVMFTMIPNPPGTSATRCGRDIGGRTRLTMTFQRLSSTKHTVL